MKVAIVLPPRERFGPEATGAIGLLVRGLALAGGSTVYGIPVGSPFDDVAFCAVRRGVLAWRYGAAVVRALRRDRPDLIEVHNRPDLALHLARLFSDRPVVLFLHNDPQGMKAARTAAQRLVLLARVAAVAPVSSYVRGRLLEGVDGAFEVSVFPNFVGSVPAADAGLRILFAGRVVADKGADCFVAACALALPRLPGWSAAMIGADRFGVGSPDTPFLRALRPAAAAAGVEMLGWRPHAEVLAAMASAGMVVVPSRWPEPFGMTALEAMACGAPLLCSGRGGLAEVVGDAAVSIDPDDPVGVAAAMVALAGDPSRRRLLAEAGLARAAAFSIGSAHERLAALRRAVVARWSERAGRPI